MSADPQPTLPELRDGAEPVQVIAVTSGKGGVGKTNVSINLGTALSKRGRSVMLLDADLGLANVDVVLGLKAQRTLAHVLDGECELDDVVIQAGGELQVVPASSGVQRMAALSPRETAGIIHAFSEMRRVPDTLIVDTAAGINDGVASFARAASDVLVVACDEPASITDAYALMKTLSRHHGINEFRVLANMARSAAQGREVFDKLSRVVHRFLDVSLLYEGFIPDDEFLRRAKDKGDTTRLMGFGHRVYKSYDPRAQILKDFAHEVLARAGKDDPLMEIALQLEDVALNDDYFVERKLYPNVDFYSGIIYQALGFPTAMFPVLFAIPRVSGWLAQWQELVEDPEQRIARPRQIYVGADERDFVSIGDRG